MAVKNLVQKALDQRNNAAVLSVEGRVRTLVDEIISAEARIAELDQMIAQCKEELKALEMPTPATLEF